MQASASSLSCKALLILDLTMQAAVGEAGFMTGLEKKSDIVSMATYAPLLVNTNNRGWNPDMIVFDNHRQEQHLNCTSSLGSYLT